jgi:multiple sugar transport system substrate-binding protein
VQEAAEDSESRFQNGRLGMFLNSRRGVPTYREITAFEWDVAPLPVGKQKAGILHADAFCMAAATKDKASTWSFIEFAMSAEGQTILAKSGRTVPSMKSVANSPAFLDPNAAPSRSKVFLDGIGHIRAVPIMETWVDIESTVGKELERGMHGEASVDEVIEAATSRTRDFFQP